MSALKLAFALIAGANRAYSATDIQARSTPRMANPRALTTALVARGAIREAFRLGGQKFFVAVPGATLGSDARDCAAANEKRRKRAIALRARQAKRMRAAG